MPHIAGEHLFLGVSAPSPDLEQYKSLAIQAAKEGKTPGQARDLIRQAIVRGLAQQSTASGRPIQEHLAALKAQTSPSTGVAGFNLFHELSKVGNVAKDIEHVANDVIKTVGPIVNDIAKVAGKIPWGTIIHDVQAAISVVPGLGTAVNVVVAAAESAYDSAVAIAHHNPLEAALDSAYNFALASVPGADALRGVLDPVKKTLISLGHIHEPIEGRILDSVIQNVPDSPRIGHLSPRSIAASLAKAIVKHVGVKHSPPSLPIPASPTNQAHVQVVAKNMGPHVLPPGAPAAPAHPMGHRRHLQAGRYAPYPR